MQAVARIAGEMWPGVPVHPDHVGRLHRQPLAAQRRHPGLWGLRPVQRPGASNGVHGRNEHVGVKQVYDSKEFLYRLVKALAGSAAK